MAVVVRVDWPEITAEQYEQARQLVNWETERPKGAIFHVASIANGGLRIVDVWESAEDFYAFGEQRLRPVTTQLGATTEPKVEIEPVLGMMINAETLVGA